MSEVAILRQSLEGDLSPEERAEALHDLAYALYRQGNLEEAILHAEDLLNTYPDYRHLGSVFWLLGVMYGEHSARQEHLEAWRQDVEAGDISLEKDEYRRAVDNYQAALEQGQLPEKQQDLYYKLGVALQWDEQYERALEFLRQVLALGLSLQPINEEYIEEYIGDVLLQMGRCFYNMRDFQQAIVLLEKAREKVARAALVETHRLLGHNYYSLKRFDKAAGFYRKVMRETRLLSPQWKEAVKYLIWTRIA